MQNPPFRPIISEVGTVTYDISQQINKIIVPYLPKQFQVDSTYEFLTILRDSNKSGMLASLDVESLFTNVPVMETIKIILQNVYENPHLPPPEIPRKEMEKLLQICTTRTPFKNINGDLYVQREGVSMGNPLGPTFANYYMCNLENSIFSMYPKLKPIMYVRYVDDICVVIDKFHKLTDLKEVFELNSVLKFTFETEVSKRMPFLDVLIDRNNHNFETSVHVKPTNHGDCLNYNSHCPERYKISVIESLLHRGYAVSHSWSQFHNEIERVTQLLTNNNFPMAIIENSIKKFLKNKCNNVSNSSDPNKSILLYFQNNMSLNYKQDENQLHKIIDSKLQPVDESLKIKLTIYYRNKKLSNLFIKNNIHSNNSDIASRHHVVYQYKCNRDGCNSTQTYIGYTSCTIKDRFRMHTQNCSSIKKHLQEYHRINKITTAELIPDIHILASAPVKRDLIFIEALYIKLLKPSLNSQTDFSDRMLKVFIH